MERVKPVAFPFRSALPERVILVCLRVILSDGGYTVWLFLYSAHTAVVGSKTVKFDFCLGYVVTWGGY